MRRPATYPARLTKLCWSNHETPHPAPREAEKTITDETATHVKKFDGSTPEVSRHRAGRAHLEMAGALLGLSFQGGALLRKRRRRNEGKRRGGVGDNRKLAAFSDTRSR